MRRYVHNAIGIVIKNILIIAYNCVCLCPRLELKLTANLALLPSSRKNDKRTHESPTPLRILINNVPFYISDAYVAILIFYLENKKNNAETTNTEKTPSARAHGNTVPPETETHSVSVRAARKQRLWSKVPRQFLI